MGKKEQEEQKEQGITVKKAEDFSEWYTQVVLKLDWVVILAKAVAFHKILKECRICGFL